jgi:hypothetical protein
MPCSKTPFPVDKPIKLPKNSGIVGKEKDLD